VLKQLRHANFCANWQDQVYQMGDYILRLETELSHARRAATASPGPAETEVDKQASVLSLVVERRVDTACCRLALWLWAGICANLRRTRCAIMRFVTRSRRMKASQALCVWVRGRRMREQVYTVF
jgi:hypothetical protein